MFKSDDDLLNYCEKQVEKESSLFPHWIVNRVRKLAGLPEDAPPGFHLMQKEMRVLVSIARSNVRNTVCGKVLDFVEYRIRRNSEERINERP